MTRQKYTNYVYKMTKDFRFGGVCLASANVPDGGKGTMLVCQPDDILEIIV